MCDSPATERRPTLLVKHWDWYSECFQISCTLPRDKSVQRRVYCSRITGPDPNYILSRDFLPRTHIAQGAWDQYAFSLEDDGIYEFGIKTLDLRSDEVVSTERRWLIVLDSDLYEYDGDELNNQYVLFTVYNLNLQAPPEDESQMDSEPAEVKKTSVLSIMEPTDSFDRFPCLWLLK